MSHNPIVQMENHTVGNWYLFSKVELVDERYVASIRIHHRTMKPEEYLNVFKENKLFSTGNYVVRHDSVNTTYNSRYDRPDFSVHGVRYVRMNSDIKYILDFLEKYQPTV